MPRRYPLASIGFALSLVLSGCGDRTEQEQQADQAQQSVQESAEEAARSLEEMARSLGQMAGSGDQPAVEPVGFRELQTAFPELEGWERGRLEGERMGSPVSFSQASVTYTRGEAQIDAKIVDSGFNQILLAPYSMFLTAGYERETEDGYEKSTEVGSHPGWERWNSTSKDGELNLLVGKRFLVTLEGSNIENVDILRDLAGRLDFQKLAALGGTS